MLSAPPFEGRLVRDARAYSPDVTRPACLGSDEIIVPEERIGTEEVRNIGAQTTSHLCKDADHLTALFTLQLSDMVVGLYELHGLDEDGLPRSGFVMDDPSELTLVHWAHGDDEAAIT
jgi:hypothetical protein